MSCDAVEARKRLIKDIYNACGHDDPPHSLEGSERELFEAYDELTGIVAEYTNGGDEMAENCSCLMTSHKEGHKGLTFDELYRIYKDSR